MIGGLLNVGKAAAPKLAAGGLLGLGATASDDAEAAVTLRLLKEAPEAYNALRKQLARDRQTGLSPMRTAEKFIHDQSFTNYDKGFNQYARKVDGTSSGDYWKSGVQGLYDQILGAVDDPDPMVVEAMDAWLESHLARETGSTMAQNRARARATRAAGAGAAATGAGAAYAGEPSTPEEHGFPPWSDYEPEPVVDTSPDMMIGNPMGAIGNAAPLSGDEWMNLLGMPMAGLQGIVRGLFGLANGEDLVTAGAEASNMMGADYQTPYGHDSDEGWRRYGQYTEDLFNDAGVDKRVSRGLGLVNQYGPQFIVPF